MIGWIMNRRIRLGLVPAILAVSCLAACNSGAARQTAPETVVFLLYGLENGGSVVGQRGLFQKVSSDEWQIGTAKLRVEDLGGCKYRVSGDLVADAFVKALTFDFSHLSAYHITALGPVEVGDLRAAGLEIKGDVLRVQMGGQDLLLETRARPLSGGLEEYPKDKWEGLVVGVSASADRLEKAMSYFRSTFCAGKPF